MVLPELERALAYANDHELRWYNDPATHVRRKLLSAARDGYFSHDSRRRSPLAPRFFYDWCLSNRHPPVELHSKRKWARVYCCSRQNKGFTLDEVGTSVVLEAMKRFQARPEKKGRAWVHPLGDSLYVACCDGPSVADGRACAMAMVDLMLEWAVWPGR